MAAASADAPELPSGWTPRPLVRAPRDMVAAAHPLAVQAGDAVTAGYGVLGRVSLHFAKAAGRA
jgi:hypothetical protein